MAIEKVDKRNQEALRVPPFKIEYWETQECRNEGYGEYFHDFNKQDMNEAVKWYRKAAEQGNSSAQCNLGICYYKGQGVAEDNEQAIKWFRKAAEQEEAVAQYFIGECYENGYGVREDIDEAIKWYRKAAEQGDEDAIEKLEELENGESDSDFDEDDQKYIDMIKSGVKLAAIKEYMEDNGVSLSEAKDYIDRLQASMG